MKWATVAIAMIFIANGAWAQSGSQDALQPRPDYRPALISPAPPAPKAVPDNMLREALQLVCRNSIERATLGNRAFIRGRDVVPQAAAAYVAQMRQYQDFACPCVVNSLDKQFDLTDASPASLERIKPAIGIAMSQTCSRDVWATQARAAAPKANGA